MKDFAQILYNTKAWKDCRISYLRMVGGLCEDCLKDGLHVPAEIIHHKVELTPDNINNPSITMSFDNLHAVCRNCHAKYHSNPKRYHIDANGNVIVK